MTETVDAKEMARLLDEWVADKHPFNPGFTPSFGLSDEQRLEPIVKAAATFVAFAFMSSGDGDRTAYAGPFVPMFGEAPALLDYIKSQYPEALGSWHDFSVYVEDRFLAAKLQDLLWIVKYSERQAPGQYARDAIENYLSFYDDALSRDFEHKPLHLHHLLLRAAELAAKIKAAKDFHPAIGERCQEWLATCPTEDYFWPIKVAAKLRAEYRPSNLDAYLCVAHAERAASSDYQVRTMRDGLFELEVSMAQTSEEKQQIHARAAKMFLDEANRAPSDLHSHWCLRQADEWAQNAVGKADLLRAIKAANSGLDLTSDLKEITAEVTVTHDEVQALRDQVLGSDSFVYALARIACMGEATLLDIEEMERRVDKLQEENPLASLVPTLHIHQGGFECCRPTTEGAKREKTIAGAHKTQSQVDAELWLKDSLRNIPHKYVVPESLLAECLGVSGVIDQEDAAILVSAFRHYWNGDYVSCVRVAAPSIEATLRNLAERVGGDVTYRRRDEKCGGYVGVPKVLEILKDSIGVSAARMLYLLLVDSHGMNLRDRTAHGMRSLKPDVDAALTLWVVTWLAFRARPRLGE